MLTAASNHADHSPDWYCHHNLSQCPSASPSPSASTSPTPSASTSANGPTLKTFFGPQFKSSAAFCPFAQQFATVSGSVLTTTYPAGSSSPSSGNPGGAQICEPFTGGTTTDATLVYQVRFPVGFQFVQGGKLPGLYGGVEPFSGGKHTSNGWSIRLMWRTGGAGEVYAYTARTVGYGDEYGKGNFTFSADGKWHTLAEHVHLNSVGASNGYVTLSYDGVQVISQTGVDITDTNTPIAGLFFSTFYGGNDSSWAPSQTMQLSFTGFGLR